MNDMNQQLIEALKSKEDKMIELYLCKIQRCISPFHPHEKIILDADVNNV
jgi:hypothetical protein